MTLIYRLENLQDAREFLARSNDKIILTNIPGSTKYYGTMIIDYMFKTLKKEFPDKIVKIEMNVDDNCSKMMAMNLGYTVNLQ